MARRLNAERRNFQFHAKGLPLLSGPVSALSHRQRKRRERQLKYLFAGLLGAGLVSLSSTSAQAQTARPLASPFNGSARFDGAANSDFSGRSVAGAGDVNGDGFPDVIIGAAAADPNGDSSGSSYVVFGGASPFPASTTLSALNGANGFRLDGAAAFDNSGSSVSDAGDVNGDGFADVIIGALFADSNGNNAGSSYVVFGSNAGFSALNLSTLNGANGFRFDGAAAVDRSGISVSGVGDVNGDGFADLIVGADSADPNGDYSGSSYVIFGKSDWLATPVVSLSSINGVNGFRLDGADEGDLAGRSVSDAGDVNGDGFADLIIGAYGANPNGNNSGSSYVVFGKADWAATPAISLSALNGVDGFRLDGEVSGDFSGFSVGGAGDVNGDGFSDLMVGAPMNNTIGTNPGSGYVIFGKADWSASPAINLSTLNGANGFRIDGQADNDKFGRNISGAGDVNGDGFSDIIAGAHAADPNGDYSGSSYVIFGKEDWSATPAINLSTLNGTNGYRLDGTLGVEAGWEVADAGDINCDGFADMVISAPGGDADVLNSNRGSTYIVFGGNGISGTFRGRTLPGDARKAPVGTADSRIWLDFDAGTAPSLETVHITRSRAELVNLDPLADVGRTIWNISTNRTGWSNAIVTLKYTNAEITGIAGGETNLHIYRAPTPHGPWTALPTTINANKNEVSGPATQLTFFTIAGITPPSGFTNGSWSGY